MNGIYAVYFTGTAGSGYAVFVMKDGVIPLNKNNAMMNVEENVVHFVVGICSGMYGRGHCVHEPVEGSGQPYLSRKIKPVQAFDFGFQVCRVAVVDDYVVGGAQALRLSDLCPDDLFDLLRGHLIALHDPLHA